MNAYTTLLLLVLKYIAVTLIIRKTCPCNVYPLEPHFHIAKLGFAGVCLFFLFLLQNIDCGYSLEPPNCYGVNLCAFSYIFSQALFIG